MKTVSLYEAKTHLSALVEAAAGGEEVIIAKNGRARARLLAVEAETQLVNTKRFGFWADLDWSPHWSFPETSAEEIALWEDGPVFPPGPDKG